MLHDASLISDESLGLSLAGLAWHVLIPSPNRLSWCDVFGVLIVCTAFHDIS